MERVQQPSPVSIGMTPQPAAAPTKRRRIVTASQRAAVSAAMKAWHAKQGHKMSGPSTERTAMQVKDGFANIERVSDDSLVMMVTQITPDMPSGSRTATVLMSPAHLAALLAPVGFQPVAA